MQFAELAKNFKEKRLPDSEVELIGEVPYDAVAAYRERALKEIAAQVELPGFRKGNVPLDMVVKKVGEVAVLEEAAEFFIRDFYPELVDTKKIDAVGRPNVRITKLAPGNPVAFEIRTAVYPDITLPKNWKGVGSDIPQETAEAAKPEDIEQTLSSLQKSRATKAEDGSDLLPELSDEFARSVGAFETLDALKESIRKGIGEEKERTAKSKRRGAIIDKLLEKTTIEIPKIFVESEIEKILAQLKDDLARFNLQFPDYLKQIGKTEDQLRDDFRAQAQKRAKLQLALNKIADEEKITPDEKEVAEEMKHALEHFKDANPEALRVHIQSVLRNEKVLQLLEGSGS